MYSQAGESYLGGRYCIQSTSAARRISMIQRPQSKRLFLPVSAMGNDMKKRPPIYPDSGTSLS